MVDTNPMILKFIRFPLDELDKIVKIKEGQGYRYFSEAVRELCLLAIHVIESKERIKDPIFVQKLQSFASKEALIDYIFNGMADHEKEALKLAIEFTNDKGSMMSNETREYI